MEMGFLTADFYPTNRMNTTAQGVYVVIRNE